MSNHDPDFSHIDSIHKALRLRDQGVLEPLYLMPLEYGGERTPLNTVYVPIGFAALKTQHEAEMIAPMMEQGLVNKFSAVPTYDGNSCVPSSIAVTAWDPDEINLNFAIWGSALTEADKNADGIQSPSSFE